MRRGGRITPLLSFHSPFHALPSLPMGLLVPVGLDTQKRPVFPCNARKSESYSCPSCGVRLVLRVGSKKQPHFAHGNFSGCTSETVIHSCAKLLVRHVVTDFLAGRGKPPIIFRQCRRCGCTSKQPFPAHIERVEVEKTLPSGFRPDVVFLRDEEAIAAAEILVSHAVDAHKANTLGIPFIELEGEAICKNPFEWLPVTDRLLPLRCSHCADVLRVFTEAILRISTANRVPVPHGSFQTSYTSCWKCSKEILIFDWPGNSGWGHQMPKQRPFPRTIQYRYSKTVEHKYWANTCPYCESIQGNFFVSKYFHAPETYYHGNNSEEELRELRVIGLDELALALRREEATRDEG